MTIPSYQITVAAIIDVVALACGVSRQEIISQRKKPQNIWARRIVYGLARELTTQSLPAIARTIGGRDHTTVLHGLRQYHELIETDHEFRALRDACRNTMHALHKAHVLGLVAGVDPVAAAQRVLANPIRGPNAVSALEIRAMAELIVEFTQIETAVEALNEFSKETDNA